MYAVSIVLALLGISVIIGYLGYKVEHRILNIFFYAMSFYFVILCLGSLMIIIAENLSGTYEDKLISLVTVVYTILQTIFIYIILPLFLISIIFSTLMWIYDKVARESIKRRKREKKLRR